MRKRIRTFQIERCVKIGRYLVHRQYKNKTTRLTRSRRIWRKQIAPLTLWFVLQQIYLRCVYTPLSSNSKYTGISLIPKIHWRHDLMTSVTDSSTCSNTTWTPIYNYAWLRFYQCRRRFLPTKIFADYKRRLELPPLNTTGRGVVKIDYNTFFSTNILKKFRTKNGFVCILCFIIPIMCKTFKYHN